MTDLTGVQRTTTDHVLRDDRYTGFETIAHLEAGFDRALAGDFLLVEAIERAHRQDVADRWWSELTAAWWAIRLQASRSLKRRSQPIRSSERTARERAREPNR